MDAAAHIDVTGSKGGEKKPKAPVEAPDSLRSTNIAKILNMYPKKGAVMVGISGKNDINETGYRAVLSRLFHRRGFCHRPCHQVAAG